METQATIVSEPVTPILVPTIEAKPKHKPKAHKPKAEQKQEPKQAVAVFERTEMPATLDGMVAYRKNDDVKKSDGSIVKATRDFYGVPSLKDYKTWYKSQPGKSLDDDDVIVRAFEQLGRDAKPLAVARMSAAASSASFILRSHTQSRAKSGLLTLGLTLKEVKLVDELHNLMTSSGKSEAECREFLGMPEIGQ